MIEKSYYVYKNINGVYSLKVILKPLTCENIFHLKIHNVQTHYLHFFPFAFQYSHLHLHFENKAK